MSGYYVKITNVLEEVIVPSGSPFPPVDSTELIFDGWNFFIPISSNIGETPISGNPYQGYVFELFILSSSITDSFQKGTRPVPDPLEGPEITVTTPYFSGYIPHDLSVEYLPYYWEFINPGTPPILSINNPNPTGIINIQFNSNGTITSPAATGIIFFTDTNTSARPIGSVVNQAAIVFGPNGTQVPLTFAQELILEQNFSLSAEAGNTNNGKLDWSYNPDGNSLLFLTAGQTADLYDTIQVEDQSGSIVTTAVNIVLIAPPAYLFTTGDDTVDFNDLTASQIAAVTAAADFYNTLSGDDIVTLPTAAHASNLGGTGVAYDLATPLVLGNGNDAVYGSDAKATIDLGTGQDTVSVDSGTLTIVSNASGGSAVLDFTAPNQIVVANIHPTTPVTVNSMAAGDVIDLSGSLGLRIIAASHTSITLNNGGTLSYAGAAAALVARSDGNGGTEITTPGSFDIYVVRAPNGECSVTATENGIALNVSASSLGFGTSPIAIANPKAGPGGLPIPAAYDDATPIDPGVYSASLYPTSLGVPEANLSGATVNEAILLSGVTSGNGSVGRTYVEIHKGNWPQNSEGCIVLTVPQLSNLVTPIFNEYVAAQAEGLPAPVINIHVSNQSSGQYQAVVILGAAAKTSVSPSNIATYSVPVALSRAISSVTQVTVAYTLPDGTSSKVPVTIPAGKINGYASISLDNALTGDVSVSVQSVTVNGRTDPSYVANVTSLFTDVNLSTPAVPTTSFSLQPTGSIVSAPSPPAVIISAPSSSIAASAISPTLDSLSAAVSGPGIVYAIDPSPASLYELTEDSASPSFDTLSFPALSGMSLFNVSTENSGTWASAGTLVAGQLLQLLPETAGIEVQTEDANGNPVVSTDPMSFYVSFGSSGTFDGALSSVPCFVTGTHIQMARGPIPIERLRAGDEAQTRFSGNARIVWIGNRRIDCRRHPRPERVWPVRIDVGAFADGVPCRALLLSPDHAVFVDGALIPIKNLINGSSIRQFETSNVEYWHVELERHDVLLAEGLPCESYLDTGNRNAFENGADHLRLYPDFAPLNWNNACAPLLQEGPAVLKAKERLFDRAVVTPGLPRPSVEVLAQGRALAAQKRRPGVFAYDLPPGTEWLQLISPTWIPAAHVRSSLDIRRLGVRVMKMRFGRSTIPLDDPHLLDGFYPIEQTAEGVCRWTDGAASLAVARGTRRFTLHLADDAVVSPRLSMAVWSPA